MLFLNCITSSKIVDEGCFFFFTFFLSGRFIGSCKNSTERFHVPCTQFLSKVTFCTAIK